MKKSYQPKINRRRTVRDNDLKAEEQSSMTKRSQTVKLMKKKGQAKSANKGDLKY